MKKQIKQTSSKTATRYWVNERPFVMTLILWYLSMWSWILLTDALALAGSRLLGRGIGLTVLIINVSISCFVILKVARFIEKHLTSINPYYSSLLIVPLFALADYLVAWLPAMLWYGPQAQADSILPIGSLSFLVIQTPFVYASRLVGFFGLAGILWTILFLVTRKTNRKTAMVPICALIICSFFGWIIFKSVGGPATKVRIMREVAGQPSATITSDGEDLIVFPEYGLNKITNDTINSRIKAPENQSKPTYFIGSTKSYKESRLGFENRLLFGNAEVGVTAYQDKYRLIPGGEDAPYIVRFGLWSTGNTKAINYFNKEKAVVKGSQQLQPWDIGGGMKLGAAVCSSIIAPQDFRSLTKSGATILSNSASLSTFGGSQLFEWQQRSMGRFMAVANSRYFVQSANGARGYAYDNNGKVLAEQIDIGSQNITVLNNTKKTVYTMIGEWLVWAGGILIVLLIVKNIRFTRKRSIHASSKQ